MKHMFRVLILLSFIFCYQTYANTCRSFLNSSDPNGVLVSLDPQQMAKALYPNGDKEILGFTAAFFQVLVNHNIADPFINAGGPSGVQYNLNSSKFAFLINDKNETADLVIFNWTDPVIEGLELAAELSKVYGKPVYIFKGLLKEKFSTSPTLNFSYILGSKYIETQIINSGMEEVPESFKDFKPQPNYLEREHPLRKAIGLGSLPIFSPRRDYLANAIPAEARDSFMEAMVAHGGFIYKILGMILHEAYHIIEGEAGVRKLIAQRDILEDREKAAKILETSNEAKALVGAYIKIVFSIADNLDEDAVSDADLEKLGDLALLAKTLKTEFPDVWNIIWRYEYTEGFAEYVSAESLISAGVVSIQDNVRFEKADGNSFPYRTGTFAGHFMRFKLKKMLFSANQDHTFSAWELIIRDLLVQPSKDDAEAVQKKYEGYALDVDGEIANLLEYLVSTVED